MEQAPFTLNEWAFTQRTETYVYGFKHKHTQKYYLKPDARWKHQVEDSYPLEILGTSGFNQHLARSVKFLQSTNSTLHWQ